MTTSLEELRAALERTSWPATAHDETYVHERRKLIPNDIYQSRIRDAAQTLLQLLETHTPEKIEALLKGEAVIMPSEPTEEMENAFWDARKLDGHKAFADFKNAYQAMRQSSEVT